jgi:membrane-associated phospholipid phosphatase
METVLPLTYRLQILALTLLGWLGIYFAVNRRHLEPQRRLDLATSLDRRIPFVPAWALVYFSTFPFVLMPFVVLTEAGQFYWTLASFITITLTSQLLHAAIPSQIQRVEKLNNLGASGWMINIYQHICKPYDNFPSMHMGLSVPAVGACYMAGGSTVGSLVLVWAVLIALSTLFTKQHYIWDILAGVMIGVVVYAFLYWVIMV